MVDLPTSVNLMWIIPQGYSLRLVSTVILNLTRSTGSTNLLWVTDPTARRVSGELSRSDWPEDSLLTKS